MRPRIGITTSTLDRNPAGPTQQAAATNLAYIHCIVEAGGIPFLLPNIPGDDHVAEVLNTLDGVLLSGGGDIDPAYWGEALHPEASLVDPLRDQFELALTREALRRDLPILGICRGVQVITVATGGDLWQDVPSQYPTDIMHRQSALRSEPTHTVTVKGGSLLARVLQPETVNFEADLNVSVNSFHHQAPRNCGTLLTVMASSPDGLTEALCVPTATFALGVQWHPEEMAGSDPLHARLFTALVTAAADKQIFGHT